MMDKKELARITLARDLSEAGEYAKALELSEEPLCDNPNHIGWLMLNVYCLEKANKLPIAYHLCKKLLELHPRDPAVWLNMTNIHARLWQPQEAIKSAKRGLQFATKDEDRLQLLVNLGCVYVDIGKFEEGLRYLDQAAKIDPDNAKVISNSGFCHLAKRDWETGWKAYHRALGQGQREMQQYGDEPEWDGTRGQRVVVYGEQGIGDQICFASVIPDMVKDCHVIMDVNPKLKGLFQRSFPEAKVYGTHKKTIKPWKREDREFDASIPLGQLGEFYRLTDESFPQKPFLEADEERVLMWRALFATKKKPCIGIAWTGGIQRTGRRFRCATLDDFLPLFKAVDAHWISLEYRPSKDVDDFKVEHPEIDLKEYPHGTLTDDYDDTAALVKALDLVLCVPTSVGHLAGALGTPMIWLKHMYPCFKIASGLPYHPWNAMIPWAGTWKGSVINSIDSVKEVIGEEQCRLTA